MWCPHAPVGSAFAHPPSTLGEPDAAEPPPERLLQTLWHSQRLRRSQLRLIDGRQLRVLHPGFWNREPGPDFRQAILQFNQDPALVGDIEIDPTPSAWKHHAHDRNPAYQSVILHAVWMAPTSPPASGLPTLALEPHLDAPWNELAPWLDRGQQPGAALEGRCSGPLATLGHRDTVELLLAAARSRLERKAAELLARSRETGWRHALLESLCASLGYKHNAWAMRSLAELHLEQPLQPHPAENPLLVTQAVLLGLGGLLPHSLNRVSLSSRTYHRSLWDTWWRHRDPRTTLPGAVWKLGGIRPANHPQRRIALAAHWFLNDNLATDLESWLGTQHPPHGFVRSLRQCLQAGPDPYWEHHWTLRSSALRRAQPLLGPSRTTDIAMNTVLPWLWIRARTGENHELQQRCEDRYLKWPAGQDNAVLRLARLRLLRTPNPQLPPLAAVQQGLLQVVRDFCNQSNALCQNCDFPKLVQSLQ